jgi:hypothetical protein
MIQAAPPSPAGAPPAAGAQPIMVSVGQLNGVPQLAPAQLNPDGSYTVTSGDHTGSVISYQQGEDPANPRTPPNFVKSVYQGTVGTDQGTKQTLGNAVENGVVQAGTLGLAGVKPDGSLTPGVTGKPIVDAAGNAASAAGSAIKGLVGDLGGGAPDPSVGPLDTIAGTAQAQQAELDRLRQQAEANPTAAPQTGLVQLDQTNIDPLRQRQGVALDQLQQAASGALPSAAEIAARDAANRASAQAYGNAAALQGGNSSGGTLRQALDAQTQAQGDIQTKLLADRAAEQATARQQLVQGITGAQTTEGQLATSNANLAQGANLANQSADVNTRAQDISREQNLISGATADTSNATAAAKAALDAKVQEQANANALKGAEIGAGASVIPKLISDRRAKTDVKSTDLVDLAESLPGYTFDYKDPGDGPGRRVGVMAQDVARSPMGAQMVQLDGDKLTLDGPNAVGAALAMSAAALREAEAAKKKRGR